MLAFYLVCLIIGGGILAFTMFAGDGHDTDAHGALDVHADVGGHPELTGDVGNSVEIHTDVAHSIEASGEHLPDSQAPHADAADAVKFLSFRNFIYFTSFFGLTGTVFTLMDIVFVFTFLSSMGIGIFSALTGYQFMKYLKKSESGDIENLYSLRGLKAKVVIPVGKGKPGKILVVSAGHQIELTAKASDTANKDLYMQGEEVLIMDTKKYTAYIVDADF